jgi:site-specific recombinase XerC
MRYWSRLLVYFQLRWLSKFWRFFLPGNQSLQMLGKVLGHKSPTATQIYARIAFDPIREAMEKAQKICWQLQELLM